MFVIFVNVRVDLQMTDKHEPLTDAAAAMWFNFRKEVASDEILAAMMLLIRFNKEHGEHAVKKFYEIYATPEGEAINSARRKVDMLYDSVRIAVEELCVLPPWCVSTIMEPGSVDSFLKWVNPLSVGKPSPKASIVLQEPFWTKYGTGVAPPIINHV